MIGYIKCCLDDAKLEQKLMKAIIDEDAKISREKGRIAGKLAQAPIKVVRLMETYFQSEKIAKNRRDWAQIMANLLDGHDAGKGKVSPIYVRNFLLMDLLITTLGHCTDAFCNLRIDEWDAREIAPNGIITIFVLEHKTG